MRVALPAPDPEVSESGKISHCIACHLDFHTQRTYLILTLVPRSLLLKIDTNACIQLFHVCTTTVHAADYYCTLLHHFNLSDVTLAIVPNQAHFASTVSIP